MSRCPSELALEAHLLDPDRSPLAAHLGACARCRARLDRMEREGEDFRRFVLPRTLDAVTEAAARPRRAPWSRWLSVGLPAGGLAAAAAAMLLVAPRPPSDYLGAKGGALSLQVFAGGGGDAPARALADGEAVPAASVLRFQVRAARPCRLWVVSVDARGEISRLYPPQGEAPEVRGAAPLPGGAVLDGVPGPERIHAVCSDPALPLEAVAAAARAAAAGGAEGVRRGAELRGLPEGVGTATVLVEKVP